MSAFITLDISICIARNHKFKTTWSDKTPMKVNLMCLTCSEQYKKNAYVAYGEESQSFGAWKERGR